jgi:hypothetical protein
VKALRVGTEESKNWFPILDIVFVIFTLALAILIGEYNRLYCRLL